MEKRISDVKIQNYLDLYKNPTQGGFQYQLMMDLQDARKELKEAKKDSVWRELPDDVSYASVEYLSSNGIGWSVPHKRTLPKTPKQELIDSFAEKNALAMKCSGLNKELLEEFVKEYEEMKK